MNVFDQEEEFEEFEEAGDLETPGEPPVSVDDLDEGVSPLEVSEEFL